VRARDFDGPKDDPQVSETSLDPLSDFELRIVCVTDLTDECFYEIQMDLVLGTIVTQR
jgi:hypothetical protein